MLIIRGGLKVPDLSFLEKPALPPVFLYMTLQPHLCYICKKNNMIKSMTGFGKSVCQPEGKIVTIETRCLNSKTLDISIKIPAIYKEKENFIRSLIARFLGRGKVELLMYVENTGTQTAYALNKPLLEKYYLEVTSFARTVDAPVSDNLLPALLKLPEVLRQQTPDLAPEEWEMVEKALMDSLEQTDNYRKSEGAHLQKDLLAHQKAILELLRQIPALEENRKENLRKKLLNGLRQFQENNQHDPNRFEQELIYYIEKLDITEEKVRLEKHLEYFLETIEEPLPSGKKLGFITQEIGREINTIGSKANDAGIQKIVVEMKDELEKIKEQLMNIL